MNFFVTLVFFLILAAFSFLGYFSLLEVSVFEAFSIETWWARWIIVYGVHALSMVSTLIFFVNKDTFFGRDVNDAFVDISITNRILEGLDYFDELEHFLGFIGVILLAILISVPMGIFLSIEALFTLIYLRWLKYRFG
jgi:hypothetical protein